MIRLPRNPLLGPLAAVANVVGLSRSPSEQLSDSVTANSSPRDEGEQAVAQKTTVQLVDDIDGSEAEETVRFAVDGTSYEIDLSAEHANALREVLAPYIVAAREAGGSAGNGSRGSSRRGSGGTSSPAGSDRQRTAQIRAWAREQGMEVNDRGRIPNTVVQAYDAAH